MAAAFVGGAFLSSFVNVVFDRLASPEVLNWLKGKKVDKKLLGRLKTSLYVVRAVLNDAEQKQITDPNVKEWLVDLEDALYVADDLLDEVATKAAIQKDQGNLLSQSLDLHDERDMVTEIEDIIERLTSVIELKDALCLKENAEDTMSWRVPSTSLVEKSDIYGREKDKEAIVELLLDDNFEGQIPMISIVGIGGIGKTTLAQLVYNDDRVKGKFDYRAWVCVAEKFEVVDVTNTIIEAITSGPCDMNNFDLLQTNLKELLMGKTFLIVLDDVWSDHPNLWKSILKPFQDGKIGSKILVTTRMEKVALVNPIIPPYSLSLLSDEDCWSLFLKCSFLSTESRGYGTLEQIGRKIVKKCKGLPLAIETLGGLLRTKCDVNDWNDILESEIWEIPEHNSMIIPALRISYQHLPSHLKRCFVYCSLFPQDYEFDKDELILLWMAEDFLQTMGRKTLEEVGRAYFNELVARSFFQPSKRDDSFRRFVMHDLMHDLATFCAGKFYFRADQFKNNIEIGSMTRHLSCNDRDMDQFSRLLTACHGAKHMRTFACMNFRSDPYNIEVSHSTPHLKYLRVLLFNSFSLDTLHPSIGELIHMRYLDLSHSLIVTLPESVSRLYNLQTLKLKGCYELKMLPSGMQELVNLRHLDISATGIEEMPKGISKMVHLQFLSNYIVGKQEENKITGLGALENLHGSLSISNIENVINGNEALEARMSDKMYINSLNLKWSSKSNVADSKIERDILDKLQPHRDLKELWIDGYRGTIFPDWLGHSSYKHMTRLTLGGCKNCCMLPSLGQLPSLNHLCISKFDSLISIGAEFYRGDESCQETPFPSLETLRFDGLKCWLEWRSMEFDNAFPQLKKLEIRNCPKLIGDLPSQLATLEELTIDWGCKQLAVSLPRAPTMLKLKVECINRLNMKELPPSICSIDMKGSQVIESVFEAMSFNQSTSLQSLEISECDSAIPFPGDCLPPSLQLLRILNCKKLDFPTQHQQQQQHLWLQTLVINRSCDSLISFPLSAFPNLRELYITGCENMESFEVPQSQDASNSSLRHLNISDCPNMKSLSTLWMAAPQLESLDIFNFPKIDSFGVPPSLKDLRMVGCMKLERCFESMDLRGHGLTDLRIEDGSESMKSFPKDGWLPASLESLTLGRCKSLQTLNCNRLSHLTSLRSLFIYDCEKMENMTGERLPASLTALEFRNCPLLSKRCEVKDPQIWPKISHIAEISVDWEQIS